MEDRPHLPDAVIEGTPLKKAFALFLLLCPAAWAQSPGFELTEVVYHIEGITQEWALAARVEFVIGTAFADRPALDLYVADKTQELINERTLHEARIEATVADRPGRPSAVRLDVYVEDTWNVIVLPYLRYDSNSGLLLSLRGRNYNFLGTMEPLRLNLDYERTIDKGNEWSVDLTFTLPFRWADHQWRWTVEPDFEYAAGEVDLELGTSLAVDFALWPRLWTLTYSQGYRLVTDETEDPNDYYLTSGLSFGTSIPTGIFLPLMREVSYSPSVYANVEYKLEENISEDRRGLVPGFSQKLAAGRVDWIGNFREGARAELRNSNTYNLNTEDWDHVLSSEIAGYLELIPFAFSARAGGFYRMDSIEEDGAKEVRGVLDDKMSGDRAAFWNSDITLKVKTFCGLLEGQGSVFFDTAVVTDSSRSFDPDSDVKIGVGIEAIAFLVRRRSIYMRASLGFDLFEALATGDPMGDNKEIFIGFGHHY